MSETPKADPDLLNAGEVALSVLFEFAQMEHVGPKTGVVVHEENLVTLLYDSLLPGYPGWRWAITVTKAEPNAPVTVCETYLQPGENSLLAPEWVPWSKRLADFREAQTLQAVQEAEAARKAADQLREEDEVDPEDDLLENDFSDFDDEIDGVDIDLFNDNEEE